MASKEKPSPQWRQLNIDDARRRAEQEGRAAFSGRLNELRAVLLSIDPARLAIGEHRWFTIREAVMNVAAHDSCGRRRCEESAATLAAKLQMTVGQWYEALRHAKRLGLVRASQRYEYGQRLDDALVVDEAALEQLVARARRQPIEPGRTSSNQVELARTSYEPGTSQLPSRSDVGRTTYKELVPNLSLPSSSTEPSSTSEQQVASGDPRWEEVEEELFYSGMKEYRKAARSARASGASPDDALAIIAWWKPRRAAWGEYSVQRLFWRVSSCRPGDRDRAGEGWPPPREGWRDPTVRRATDLRWRTELQQHEAAAAEATAVADDREVRFGPELDALDDGATRELFAGHRIWLQQYAKHGRTGAVRAELLARLEAKGGEL